MPDADLISTSFLESLADSLCSAVVDRGEGLLVHMGAEFGGASVGVLPLDGRAPTDLLLGATAPLDWLVLGVATLATARLLDSGGRLGRAALVILVDRDDRVVGCLRHNGLVITEAPTTGPTLDCLRLALGLPTPPPEVPPAHLFAVLCLARLAEGGSDAAVVEVLKSSEDLVQWLDWDRVRRLAVGAAGDELGLTAEDANWLDNGAFARWVTGGLPPLAKPDGGRAASARRGRRRPLQGVPPPARPRCARPPRGDLSGAGAKVWLRFYTVRRHPVPQPAPRRRGPTLAQPANMRR